MTYRQYKLSLLCFLLVFALRAGSRFLVKGSELPTLIFLYTFGVLYWLALFYFLLHARNKGITEANSNIAPAKLLPILVAWFAFISFAYCFAMTVIYETANAMVHRTISEEEMLGRAQRAATDSTKTPEQRLKAAQYHFKYSGQGITYKDNHDRNIEYKPDESAKLARLQYLGTLREQQRLYNFMIVSAMVSLLSGIVVACIYFRTRKKLQPG